MPVTVTGQLGEVILAHFKPNEDVLLGIKEVVKRHNISTGVILNIVGGLTVADVGYFSQSGPVEETRMAHHHLTGPFEASGHGMIGLQEDGEPYIHVHITLTCGETTVCGHLDEGCIVRSLIPASHFTIFIARIEGAELLTRWDRECRHQFPKVYPNGAPYHEIKAVALK